MLAASDGVVGNLSSDGGQMSLQTTVGVAVCCVSEEGSCTLYHVASCGDHPCSDSCPVPRQTNGTHNFKDPGVSTSVAMASWLAAPFAN